MSYHQVDEKDDSRPPMHKRVLSALSFTSSSRDADSDAVLLKDHPSSSLSSFASWVVPHSPPQQHHHDHDEHQPLHESTGHHRQRSHRDLSSNPLARLLPFLIVPVRLDDYASREDQISWLPEEQMSAEWLTLLYDLVIVAVLTVFSIMHEMASPAAIGTFYTYFCLVWWTWCSQSLVDIRFSAEDVWNRIIKLLQLILFMYLGGGGAKWDICNMHVDPQGSEEEQTHQKLAAQSFTLVVISFAALRMLLAVQVAVILVLARKTNRPTKSLFLQFAATCVSAGILVATIFLPDHSRIFMIARICLLYTAISIEIIMELVCATLKSQIPASPQKIAMRFGILSIIVLGEGFVGTLKALAKAIGTFSSKNSSVYLSVSLSVLVIYVIWSFLFSGFDHHQWMGRRRAFLWILLHFPMHFLLLLVMSGQINVISSSAFTSAMSRRVPDFFTSMNAALQGVNVTLDEKLATEFSQTKMWSSFNNHMNELRPEHSTLSEDDRYVLGIEYLSDFIVFSAYNYGLEIGKDVYKIQDKITEMGLEIYLNHTAVAPHRRAQAASSSTEPTTPEHGSGEGKKSPKEKVHHLLEELVSDILEEAFLGASWLLPSAGALLIVIGLTHVARSAISGSPLRLLEGLLFLFGIALSLLGFLNVGKESFAIKINEHGEMTPTGDLPPLLIIILKQWTLPLLAGVLTFLYLVSLGLLAWARHLLRRQSGLQGR